MDDEDPFEIPCNTRQDTDWALCCLCQEKAGKDLRHPYKKKCYHAAYQTLEDKLKAFVDNGIHLPLGVNLQCLDDGSGIASTMLKNEAKYHNGCREHLRSHNLQRAVVKRSRKDSDDVAFSPKKLVLVLVHS